MYALSDFVRQHCCPKIQIWSKTIWTYSRFKPGGLSPQSYNGASKLQLKWSSKFPPLFTWVNFSDMLRTFQMKTLPYNQREIYSIGHWDCCFVPIINSFNIMIIEPQLPFDHLRWTLSLTDLHQQDNFGILLQHGHFWKHLLYCHCCWLTASWQALIGCTNYDHQTTSHCEVGSVIPGQW